MPEHLTSVRFDEETIKQLKTLAEIRNTNVAEEVRRAVERYLADLRNDAQFEAQAREAAKERADLVKQLLGS